MGEDRRQADQGYQHQQPQVLGVPAPGQGEAGGANDGSDHQPDGRRHPVVDGGDRDDVQVCGGDAGGGQRDRTDPPAGPAAQPDADADERARQRHAAGDADLRPQQAGLARPAPAAAPRRPASRPPRRRPAACRSSRTRVSSAQAQGARARRACAGGGGGGGRGRPPARPVAGSAGPVLGPVRRPRAVAARAGPPVPAGALCPRRRLPGQVRRVRWRPEASVGTRRRILAKAD